MGASTFICFQDYYYFFISNLCHFNYKYVIFVFSMFEIH